jgi:hypothetical protein
MASLASLVSENLATIVRVARRQKEACLWSRRRTLPNEGAQIRKISVFEGRRSHSALTHALQHDWTVIPYLLRHEERRSKLLEIRQIRANTHSTSTHVVTGVTSLSMKNQLAQVGLPWPTQVLHEVQESQQFCRFLFTHRRPSEASDLEGHTHARHVIPKRGSKIKKTSAEVPTPKIRTNPQPTASQSMAPDTALALENQATNEGVVRQRHAGLATHGGLAACQPDDERQKHQTYGDHLSNAAALHHDPPCSESD